MPVKIFNVKKEIKKQLKEINSKLKEKKYMKIGNDKDQLDTKMY